MSKEYALPSSPRHGTVLPITQAEINRLRSALEHLTAATG